MSHGHHYVTCTSLLVTCMSVMTLLGNSKSFHSKQLLARFVSLEEATEAIADIIILSGQRKEDVPSNYKRLPYVLISKMHIHTLTMLSETSTLWYGVVLMALFCCCFCLLCSQGNQWFQHLFQGGPHFQEVEQQEEPPADQEF